MKSNWLITILMAMAMLVLLVGCEGPEGPAGAQGEQGDPGDPVAQYTYLGDDANTCGHCHGDVVETWSETGHSHAWDDLGAENQSNLYCVQCHTVGFDAEVAYGDTVVVTPGPDVHGFDDYWPPITAEDEMRADMLKNVQCESCHGSMGPTIYDHEPTVNFLTGTVDATDPSMCSKCHEQVDEWQESGHGMVLETHDMTLEEFNDEFNAFSSCWECHTGEGFASLNDPYWAAEGRPETAHLIGCQTCHDPHDDTNEHQLRNVDDYTVVYDANDAATFTGYGPAQTCVQCHHARRDVENVEDQIENGYAYFGPHGSPQMDMYLGSGSYEIAGYDYDREHSHQTFDPTGDAENESCVMCHMEMRDHSDPLGWKGGHDFEPTPATCSVCHTVPDDFDYHGEPSDLIALADQLITAIGVDPEYLGDADSTTVEQRMAGYAYVFFMNDGSNGIHNPEYARSLLQNALDFIETTNAKQDQSLATK